MYMYLMFYINNKYRIKHILIYILVLNIPIFQAISVFGMLIHALHGLSW